MNTASDTPSPQKAKGEKQAPDRQPIVVHVLDQFGIGGMETVALNVIARTRSRYRHQVVCLRGAGRLATQLEALDVPVTTIGKRPGKDLGAYLRLRRLLQNLAPDLVHTYNIGAIDVAFWARAAGVRTIVHAEHGRDAVDPKGLNPKYRRLRKWLGPAITGFVAVSSDLDRWLCEEVGVPRYKVHLIYNGIDTERYRPGALPEPEWPAGFMPPDAVVIGSVGRLDSVKAFDLLLEAFARLRDQVVEQPVRLIIVGDGPERDALERRVEALGLTEDVWLAGEREDVDCVLQGLDIYVCSSIAEGIALTVLEAMASALPVVATNVGGNPELVIEQETGALVPPSDATALAAAIRQFVENPDRASAQGAAGRARVCRYFSIEAMTRDYCELYDQLLGAVAHPTDKQARS